MPVITETEQQRLLETADLVRAQAKRQHIDAFEFSLLAESGFSVTARSGDVETLEHNQEKSLAITVYHDQRTGSASTTDLSLEAIVTTLEKASNIAQYAAQDKYSGLPEKNFLAFNYPQLDLYHPWNISPSDAIQIAIQCEAIAREQDVRIIPADGASVTTHNYFKILGNSLGFQGHYPLSEHSISCSVVAQEGGEMQRDYDYTVARKPELLDDFVHIAKHAAHKALHHLGSRRIKTQQCPVIFFSRIAKGLVGTFISAISGKNLYRETSFLSGQLHQKIFPPYIQIFQQPHMLCGLASAPFDSEGVKTADRHYIKEGELVSYVLGSYSARKLGTETTGNAGGVFNLSISHSDMNLVQICKEMQRGLLVTELMGHGVNMLTGDYSRGASGFWVENGEIQFPVEEISIAGNLKDMFKNIVAVGNDLDISGSIRSGSIWIEKMTVAGE